MLVFVISIFRVPYLLHKEDTSVVGGSDWLKLFKEKQKLEEEVASLEAQVPSVRVVPAISIGKDEVALLKEKTARKKAQLTEIEEKMKSHSG